MSVRRQQACGRRRALLRTLLRTLFPVFRPSLRLLVARGLRRRFTGGWGGGCWGGPRFWRSPFFSCTARQLFPLPRPPGLGVFWGCLVAFFFCDTPRARLWMLLRLAWWDRA